MPKVILNGYIEVPNSDLNLVLMELAVHIKLTREEPGCLVFKVEQSQENMCRFAVYEEFESLDAFEKHRIRVKQSRWGSITKDAQRNYSIKTV